MLPVDFDTPRRGLGDAKTDCYFSSVDDKEIETPNLTQPLNSTQTTQYKGKKRVSISFVHDKSKKGGVLMLTH